MSRFFKHNGVLMFEPDPVAGSVVVRKATAAEIAKHEGPKESDERGPGAPNFSKMTKEKIEQWALDAGLGNLNTNQTKKAMIEKIEELLA